MKTYECDFCSELLDEPLHNGACDDCHDSEEYIEEYGTVLEIEQLHNDRYVKYLSDKD